LEFEILRPEFEILAHVALCFVAINTFECIKKILENASILASEWNAREF
jgi:hypothetical protein